MMQVPGFYPYHTGKFIQIMSLFKTVYHIFCYTPVPLQPGGFLNNLQRLNDYAVSRSL